MTVKIGKGFKLAYMSGVIIGRNCTIGENVHIKQGVTIGDRNKLSDVTIGDNVLIGCNSSILGGKITIGNNVTIGAHSLVLDDIPPNSVYMNKVTPIIKHTHIKAA
jgi:serine O-acetyltransferase